MKTYSLEHWNLKQPYKGPQCTNLTRSVSNKCTGQRAGSTGCALGSIELVAAGPGNVLCTAIGVSTPERLVDGDADVRGAASESPFLTYFNI